MGRADAKTLAHGDVERHGRLAAVGVVDGHGHGGALIAWGQVDFAHARRERPALRVGARQHRGALARLLALITRPVRDQARKRRLIVRAKMHPAPRVVGEERAPRTPVPKRLRGAYLPGYNGARRRRGALVLGEHRLALERRVMRAAIRRTCSGAWA